MAIADLIYIDGDGLHLPDFPQILEDTKARLRTALGADLYLEADSLEGQITAIFCSAIYDTSLAIAQAYLSVSPLTAQGDALSRNVRINGIARLVPSNSTVDLKIVGTPGTTILSGQVQDTNGHRWLLPASVTIPSPESEVTVTATAVELGAIRADAGTVTKILTPTRGWISVTNETAASIGDPVEGDAALRLRQAISTMLPAQSPMESIVGEVARVNHVTRLRGYENDTNIADENGIPPHSIAIVAEGGLVEEIAQAIHVKKPPGSGLWAPDFDHRPHAYDGASVSSLLVETGTKVFTTGAGIPWEEGMRLRAVDSDDYSTYMEGLVVSYVGTTLTLEVDTISGAGTIGFWLIGLSFPGGTTVLVADQQGVQTPISFIRPQPVRITVEVSLTTLVGFVAATRDVIAQAIADYLNMLKIGDDILLNRLYSPANLGNVGAGATYYVDGIRISRTGEGGLDTDNLVLAFNEVAECLLPDDVLVIDTPVP